MTTYKTVKFPIEITRGKAADLYRLKFLRRSEKTASVRHFMKHTVGVMGRQVDLWFKEQLFTLDHLSREQERVYESRKRLKKEKRRIKKEEYARYQEQVRQKLGDIRRRLLSIKVVKKFRENVELNRQYRLDEMVKRPNVDFLRVPGNERFIWGTEGDKPGGPDRRREEHNDRKHKMPTTATALTNFDSSKANKGSKQETVERKDDECGKTSPQHHNSDLSDIYAGDYGPGQSSYGNSGMAIYGQNVLAPSPRMETIPEENLEEVEIEVEDTRGKIYADVSRYLEVKGAEEIMSSYRNFE